MQWIISYEKKYNPQASPLPIRFGDRPRYNPDAPSSFKIVLTALVKDWYRRPSGLECWTAGLGMKAPR